VPEYSKHQQNIIKNYYENRENIAIQRVQELVTELYLSEGKKRKTQWERLEKHLLKLDVKQETIDALREKDDPQLVAKLAERLGKELE
jgi:sensor domain CHASE-containing protein